MLTRAQIRRNLHDGLKKVQLQSMGEAKVQKAARRIAAVLNEMGIHYAVVGGLAVMAHGHLRATTDVDLLMTADGLRQFKERWLGLGWVEVFKGSKNMRDAINNVKVEILLTGAFPGDGKPKPVAFPDPKRVSVDLGGISTLKLPTLIELKLASAMTAPDRLGDYADVIRLIQVNRLPRSFHKNLNPWVRDAFDEMWERASHNSGDY